VVGLAGSSLESEGYRFGGEFNLLVPLGSERFLGWVGVGATREGRVLRTVALGPSAGLLAHLTLLPRRLALEAGMGGAASVFLVSSDYEGETASDERLVAGVEGRLNVLLQLNPTFSLSLGGRATAQRPRLVVEQRGRTVAEQARIQSTVHFGVRVTP